MVVAVDRRRLQQLQEDADRKMALSLQAQETSGVAASSASGSSADSELLSTGRVAAALMDDSSSSSGSSKYRSTPNQSSNSSASSSLYRSSSSAAGSSSSSSSQSQGSESHSARDRYGKQKGISSDQFFGRDQEDEERARGRLQQLSGSSSISSDMIHSDGAHSAAGGSVMDMVGSTWSSLRTNQGGARPGAPSGTALNKLSESVAGFFDDIQKRIG